MSSKLLILLPFMLLMFSGCSGEITSFSELAGQDSKSDGQTFTCTSNSLEKAESPSQDATKIQFAAEITPVRLGGGIGIAILAVFLIAYTIWRRNKYNKHVRILLYTLSVFFVLSTIYIFKKQIIYILSISTTDTVALYAIDFLWFLVLGLSLNRVLDNFFWYGLLKKNEKSLVPKIYILVSHTFLYVLVGLLFMHFGLGRSVASLIFTSSAVFAILIYLSRPVTDSAIAGFMVENNVMEKGDHVQIGEHFGTVQDIDSQRVILFSDEKNLVYLPNTDVQNRSVVNHSRPSPQRMLEVSVTLEYETTPGHAFRLIEQAIRELDEKITTHSVYIKDFNSFGITYGVFYMHEFDPHRRSQTAILSAIYYKIHKDPFTDFGYDKYDSTNNSPISTQNRNTHQSFSRLQEQAETRKLEVLRRVDFFAALSKSNLEELAKHCVTRVFGPPENIIRQGEPGESMFVIVEGRARVLLNRDDVAPIEVAIDGPGNFFGEMALLTGKPRGATVRAMDDICLLEIPKSGLQVLLERDPDLVQAISEIVASRKAQTSAIEKSALERDKVADRTFADTLRTAILTFFGLKAQ